MKFEDFRLSKEILRAISDIGFEEPTPIQVSAIPLLLKGSDVIGQAQTGTGKTAAFGIPIVERCRKGKNPFAIILEPTRELAVQVSEEISKIGKFKKIGVLPIYGGTSIERQIKALRKGIDVIVGTPGRIIDHMNRKTVLLSDIKVVVLDEADEMLNMGFIEDIETILKTTTLDRQTLLFSATMPQPIINIAKRHMKNPERIKIDTKELVVPKIKQIFYEVREEDKVNALSRLIDVEDPQLAIVFCHTKREVDDVTMKLNQMGYNAAALHGDYTQSRREEVIRKFRDSMIDILVATDVASRGLDIQNVTHVINFSIPQNPESYIHRIGRTGRAGKTGMAITFVTPREYRHLRLIEKTAKTVIDKKRLPSSIDVIRAKGKNIVRDIKDIIESNKHAGYIPMINELSVQYSATNIAAAGLYVAFGEIKEIPEEPYERRSASKNGMVRLFMTIGRKDRIKVADIVRSIASEANIPHSRIGNIDVLDRFTFVEVPEELADRVIRSVDDMMMKGRRIKIEKAVHSKSNKPMKH
jgi:ATP-dependent RNA helicase DeaD